MVTASSKRFPINLFIFNNPKNDIKVITKTVHKKILSTNSPKREREIKFSL
jgi:hypothetical protein